MPLHSFTIQLAGFFSQDDDYEDMFYNAGCDDALIVFTDGKIRLDFDREADSFEDAKNSALRDIDKTGRSVISVSAS